MKIGKSLRELAEEIERRANNKRDMIVNTGRLEMQAIPFETIEPQIRLNVGQESFQANELAHDQIGTYTEIPSKYYDRMRKESPELLARNVNHWFKEKGENRMVRTLDGKARAFLSDRYRPLENEDLALAILPILLSNDRFDLMSCEVTDKRLYLKVVDKAVNRELAKTGNQLGDGQHKIVQIVAPAITISNSEVGAGALSIQAGMFNRFCSNLATFEARSMKKYHVGARHEMLGDFDVTMLSADTRQKSDVALWAQVRDVLNGAFDETRFQALVDTVEGTRKDDIREADIVKIVTLSSRAVGVTEGEEKGILKHLIEGGDLTRFGVHNAITAFSQTVESYDRATELERAGAALVELPRGEWQKIVALAS
jgi:hypothetical protein